MIVQQIVTDSPHKEDGTLKVSAEAELFRVRAYSLKV